MIGCSNFRQQSVEGVAVRPIADSCIQVDVCVDDFSSEFDPPLSSWLMCCFVGHVEQVAVDLLQWRSFGVSGNDGKRTSDSQEGLMIAGVVFIVYFILEVSLHVSKAVYNTADFCLLVCLYLCCLYLSLFVFVCICVCVYLCWFLCIYVCLYL